MSNREVIHLIGILKNKSLYHEIRSKGSVCNILDNVEYCVPRLRDPGLLSALVDALFNSQLLYLNDAGADADNNNNNSGYSPTLLDLHALARSIFQWKLEISEPTLPLDSFYRIWDKCFTKSSPKNWTLPKLFLLSGILATETTFERLQKTSFVDGTGRITGFYKKWFGHYFLPIWSQAFSRAYNSNTITATDSLALVYSILFRSVALGTWKSSSIYAITLSPQLSVSLVRVLGSIFQQHPQPQILATRIPVDQYCYHIYSTIPFTLQVSLQNTDTNTVYSLLCKIVESCKSWSAAEIDNSSQQGMSALNKTRSTVFITLIVTLKAFIQARDNIPSAKWYYQILLALFHLSFISQEFGTSGFLDYEFVYHCAVRGVCCQPQMMYLTVAAIEYMEHDIFKSEQLIGCEVDTNKTSKILFLLNFVENASTLVSSIPKDIVADTIYPIIRKYLLLLSPKRGANRDILEAAYAAMLSLYTSPSLETAFTLWRLNHVTEYLTVAINHFVNGMISDYQIKLVTRVLASFLSNAKATDEQLFDKLTLRLLRIPIKRETENQRRTLIECLLCQILFVPNDARRCCQYLDSILNIIENSKFDKRHHQEILDSMWDAILASRSDGCIRWWYTHIVAYKSKL